MALIIRIFSAAPRRCRGTANPVDNDDVFSRPGAALPRAVASLAAGNLDAHRVIDQAGEQDQRQEPPVPPAVEHVACHEQQSALPAPVQQVDDEQKDYGRSEK